MNWRARGFSRALPTMVAKPDGFRLRCKRQVRDARVIEKK